MSLYNIIRNFHPSFLIKKVIREQPKQIDSTWAALVRMLAFTTFVSAFSAVTVAGFSHIIENDFFLYNSLVNDNENASFQLEFFAL